MIANYRLEVHCYFDALPTAIEEHTDYRIACDVANTAVKDHRAARAVVFDVASIRTKVYEVKK
jgi:hypothetical protein